MAHPSIDPSTRVALAAYLHDLGKFAERAGVFDDDPRLDAHLTLYCPFHNEGRWFSHRHAAHTALAFGAIERLLPDTLLGDTTPFAGRKHAGDVDMTDTTDSLVNAAAAHHKPETFLQWIVATADRVASGFEREEFDRYNAATETRANGLDHYTSRQLTLFEQIRLEGTEAAENTLSKRYALRALSPRGIFPAAVETCEVRDRQAARREYRALWDDFLVGLERIPASHRSSLPLWLDHFDSLWLAHTHAIPAATAFGVKPEVSLYDHSHAAAALAVALWRWHEANGKTGTESISALRSRSDYNEPKFLLVQGDFFGIQDFIFAAGGESRKQAAKLLRGRSFQVSLFTELAALRVLDELGLPPTSQIINAAGKFMIVAPDTPEVRTNLATVRDRLDTWFLEHTFGLAGIGLAWTGASCADFLRRRGERDEHTPFARLMTRLRQQLDIVKHQRFGLCTQGGRAFTEAEYPFGTCAYNGRLPADKLIDGTPSCKLSRDQIAIGESLIRLDRLIVVDATARDELHDGRALRSLEVDLFGYTLAFTASAEATGKFGPLAGTGVLRRCWDFAAATEDDREGKQPLWSGFARRFISGYVPRVSTDDHGVLAGRYDGLVPASERPAPGELKTLDMLACADRRPDERDPSRWLGVAALGVLKGDIDNLGELFRVGLRQPTFAKMAALSRQVNGFFAIYLPWLLAREFRDTYTVFAGGDDFFLIGPWRSVQKLAARLRDDFHHYVAGNAGIHFSAGIATQKPGAPIHSIAELAEEALGAAKGYNGKNAITCFGVSVLWSSWEALEESLERLDALRRADTAGLSTGYVYGLQQFVEMRRMEETERVPEAAMWRARLAYRTRRFVVDKRKGLDEDGKRRLTTQIIQDIGGHGIEKLGAAYRIVLFNHLYQFRDR